MIKETKNAPTIRFQGFTDDWERRKLGELITEYKEVVTSNCTLPILTSSKSEGVILQEKHFGHKQNHDITGYNILPRGYCTYRNRSDGVDFTFNINSYCDKGIISKFYPVFCGNKNDTFFISLVLNNSKEVIREIGYTCTGTGQKVLAFSDLQKMKIPTTSFDEQRKIRQYFSNLDNIITLHQRKLDQLKTLKKYFLQNMFPTKGEKVPRIRFKGFTGDWEQRKLGDYVTIISGDAPSKFDEGNELYVKVDDLNCNSKYVIDSKNKVALHESINKAPEGSVVFPKRGAAIMTNKVRILADDCYIDTNLMALSSNKIDSEFLYNIISKEGLYKIADTSTIPQINNKHIEPYEVLLPRLDEQRTIGKFFKDVDNFITLHQRKLEQLQTMKKFMLQNLFI